MKKVNSVIAVLSLLCASQWINATEFKISNQNSTDAKNGNRVRVALVVAGVMPRWSAVIEPMKQISASTGLKQLLGIWVEYKRPAAGVRPNYYYRDVQDLKIPVARLGIPIAIGAQEETSCTVVIGSEMIYPSKRDAASVHNYVNP